MKKGIAKYALSLFLFFCAYPSTIAQNIAILKTSKVFIEQKDKQQLQESELQIYWIIDRNNNELRIVDARKVHVVKLQELEKIDNSVCNLSYIRYSSDHEEVKSFFIDMFFPNTRNELIFVRLVKKVDDGLNYYITNKEKDLIDWFSCKNPST
ncbi:MAG TPA: hypothetical protein DDX98_10265 [Bacteroidales bacterium]|jgi:hypothetical protein|nr:hypothetical protein [Bacteroidales bacterium]